MLLEAWGQWRLCEAFVVQAGSPRRCESIGLGWGFLDCVVTFIFLSRSVQSWGRNVHGKRFTLSRSLLSPSGDKGCYLSSPELRYLPAQETATSSKRAQWRGTGIGRLRPNFFRVEYSNGVPVESSDFQLLKSSVWSA